MPIWLHSILLVLLETIAPALTAIFVLAHEPARQLLGIDGAHDPVPILVFLGLPVLSMLVFRYLTKARCKRCGGQAQFRAMLPSQYTCKACGAVHHTRISPVSLGHRLRLALRVSIGT